jgi:hypothetical protein
LNGSKLPAFEAFDDDAGIFGDVTFAIEADLHNSFEFVKIDRKFSELQLKSAIEEKVYEVHKELKIFIKFCILIFLMCR